VVIRGKPDGWIGHSEPDHRDARRLFPTIAMSRCSGAPKRMTVSLSCCAFVMGMTSFAKTGSGQNHATKTRKRGTRRMNSKRAFLCVSGHGMAVSVHLGIHEPGQAIGMAYAPPIGAPFCF